MNFSHTRTARRGYWISLSRTGAALAVALALAACGGGEDRPWTGDGDAPWTRTNWTQTASGGWSAPGFTEGYDWVDGEGWVYWSSKGGSDTVVCKDFDGADMLVGPKAITIRNNSDRTIYPYLTNGRKDKDEWKQACLRDNGLFATKHAYRLLFNGDQGVPSGSSVTVTLPLFSDLSDGDHISWWNGGRIGLADGKGGISNPKDVAVAVPDNVSCEASGTSCQLTLYQAEAEPMDNNPVQLAEYTFGASDMLPKEINKDETRLLRTQNVGYNISYVDHVYLPVAMTPAGNPYIGYSGSVQSLPEFRRHLGEFLAGAGEGWPVYNMPKPLKVPGGYNIFAQRGSFALKEDRVPVKRPGNREAPFMLTTLQCLQGECSDADAETEAFRYGAAVKQMEALWASCVTWDDNPPPPKTLTCPAWMAEKMQVVKDFFKVNHDNYRALYTSGSCNAKPEPGKPPVPSQLFVPFTFGQVVNHIYGWVPFNEGCGPDANPLGKTTMNQWTHQKVQDMYIHELQYNYTHEDVIADPRLNFNPYVKLIHEDLQMNAYGFSVDDAVGFMSELGSGIIVTVGGAEGLGNQKQFSYTDGFSVVIGLPKYWNDRKPHHPILKRYGVCEFDQDPSNANCDRIDQDVEMPSTMALTGFRVGTVKSEKGKVRVRFTDIDDNVYDFVVPERFKPCTDANNIAQCPSNRQTIKDAACSVTDSEGVRHRRSEAWCNSLNPNQQLERDAKGGGGLSYRNYLSFTQPVDLCLTDDDPDDGKGCHK